MNIVLFDPAEIGAPLSRSDRRARHIVEVLRREIGDSFDAGIVNGASGKATLRAIDADALTLAFNAMCDAAPPDPITLIVGLPRPQTARDILRDATTLGVGAIHFVATERGDPNYAQSTLWSSDEWRRHVIAGAEQAFDTRIPEVTRGRPLGDVIASLDPSNTRLALDNYEASLPLGDWPIPSEQPLVLAVGAERGWSDAERELLRMRCFGLAHLGPRVLRTETAVIAALTLGRARLGLM